jgi:type II secretory pathway component GspD/PulD (secretin)
MAGPEAIRSLPAGRNSGLRKLLYTFRIVLILVLASALASAPVASGGPQSAAMPPLPVTQLDGRQTDPDLDGQRISLAFSTRTPIHAVLLLLVRDTRLSVVPDPSLDQTFIGDLKRVTVREALDLILEPLGLDYAVRGQVVRVFRRELETRFYSIDYVMRSGSRSIGAAESSGLYSDLAQGVRTLLSANGRMNLDRTAALLQVTDTQVRLVRVEQYLEAAMLRATRQVQIEGKIIEVELRDEFSAGIDWRAVQSGLATSTTAARTLGPTTSEGVALALMPNGFAALMNALAAQGTVNVLSSPLITAMNNEPAVMRVGSRDPQMSSEGMTLRVTPQISADGIIHLSINPIISTREADTLVRVRQGETIVIAGWMLDRDSTDTAKTTRRKTDLVILLTPTILGSGKAR